MNNQLNKLVSEILSKNEGDTRVAIQQLFQLLGAQPEEHHQIIQKAILYSMENLHEWANIMKYAQKWKTNEFKRGFIARMKKRVNQAPQNSQDTESMQQVKRLIEKYWKTRSPKKQENVYKQAINIKNLMRNISLESLNPKEKNIEEVKTVKNQNSLNQKAPTQQQQEKTDITEHYNVKADNLPSQQLDSNRPEIVAEKKQKADPLASVTGRPPILKKKSIFQNPIKIVVNTTSNQSSNEQKKKAEQANIKSGRMTNSKIFNIMKKFGEKEEVKSLQNWENFGKSKENSIINKVNEQFPADRFNFGSNKKSTDSQLMKKIPISPRKYDPTKQVTKLIHNNQAKEEQKKLQHIHQFSFALSQKKIETESKPLEISTFKPSSQPVSSEKIVEMGEDQFVFHDNAKQSDKDENIISQHDFQNGSFQISKQPQETPMFVFDNSKKRRSSFNRNEAIQIDEELKLYDPDIKLRYFMKEMQVRNGTDTMTLFQHEFDRFLRQPEAYRL